MIVYYDNMIIFADSNRKISVDLYINFYKRVFLF